MKYTAIFFALIFMTSCQKEKTETEVLSNDSTLVNEQQSAESLKESTSLRANDSVINNAPKTKEVLESGVMREEKDRVIIRMADGHRLPLTIGEKFTETHDKLILKITDFSKPEIKATINAKDPKQNIRFNQIKMPDGTMDGPFGKEITHEVKGKGEVWLIIGKNNMAEGTITGDFSVTIE